jgi:hypothetical protein
MSKNTKFSKSIFLAILILSRDTIRSDDTIRVPLSENNMDLYERPVLIEKIKKKIFSFFRSFSKKSTNVWDQYVIFR